jgi:phage terminase large subunit-like protein
MRRPFLFSLAALAVFAMSALADVPKLLTPKQASMAQKLAELPKAARDEVLDNLSPNDQAVLGYLWEFYARPAQLEPAGEWTDWLYLAGRGSGKTRTGGEFIRKNVELGTMKRVALIAPTAKDARDVMVEGESGLLALSPPNFRPIYEPSKARLTWPNGAQGFLFSAEEPNRLRGPQFDGGWADEMAAWKYPEDTWDNYQFGLRLGKNPRTMITTTPRPIPLLRSILKALTTFATRGSTYENSANLPVAYLRKLLDKYEGTRLGRQELHAEILDDNPRALWKRAIIDALRVKSLPILRRVAIGVDPAVTAKPTSDETGIVSAGIGECRCKGKPEIHAFVMDDVSGIMKPHEWAKAVKDVHDEREANHAVAEINKGGDLVVSNLQTFDKHLRVHTVRATRGKDTRAEPVASLYEQGKVHHLGSLPILEDQLCDWDPSSSDSPDRLDALVWVLTDLMLGEGVPTMAGLPKPKMPQRRM